MRLTKEVLKDLEVKMNGYLGSAKENVMRSLELEAEEKEKYLKKVEELKASKGSLDLEETYTVKGKTHTRRTELGELKENYVTARRGIEDFFIGKYSGINSTFKASQDGVTDRFYKVEKERDVEHSYACRDAFIDLTARNTYLNTVALLAAAEKYSNEKSFGYKLSHLGEVWRLHKEKKILRNDLMNRFGMDKKGLKNVVKFLVNENEDKYEHTYGFTQFGKKLEAEPEVRIDEALGEVKEDPFFFHAKNDSSKNRMEEFQGAEWNNIRRSIEVDDEDILDDEKDEFIPVFKHEDAQEAELY